MSTIIFRSFSVSEDDTNIDFPNDDSVIVSVETDTQTVLVFSYDYSGAFCTLWKGEL